MTKRSGEYDSALDGLLDVHYALVPPGLIFTPPPPVAKEIFPGIDQRTVRDGQAVAQFGRKYPITVFPEGGNLIQDCHTYQYEAYLRNKEALIPCLIVGYYGKLAELPHVVGPLEGEQVDLALNSREEFWLWLKSTGQLGYTA